MPGHASKSPGVYLEETPRAPQVELPTGVPAFIGEILQPAADVDKVVSLDLSAWAQREQLHGTSWAGGYLGFAVRGFFENGGKRCFVVPLFATLAGALGEVAKLDGIDLVSAPGIAGLGAADMVSAQAQILETCAARGDCFAILDSPLLTGTEAEIIDQVKAHRDALDAALAAFHGGDDGALYFPWLKVRDGAGSILVPPSGHIAGVYARTDERAGFHKAPANEVLEDALDLQLWLSSGAQESVIAGTAPQINCLRPFTGRGMRIWGARTLSRNPAWTYINVRRTVLTIGRWLDLVMASVVFEPNDLKLWIRISREISGFLEELHRRGALKGASADEAFFVKCDAETNPPRVRDLGQVVTEIGLAPVSPSEFLVVRLVRSADGSAVAGVA